MKLILAFLLFLAGTTCEAQVKNPVKWTFAAKKISGNTFEVVATAAIQPGWHVYAQVAGEGPVPTSFTFNRNPLFTLEGKPKELGRKKTVYEEVFKSKVYYYEQTVSFVQTVKVKGTAKANVTGEVEFMVCNDRTCLPPTSVPFTVALQ